MDQQHKELDTHIKREKQMVEMLVAICIVWVEGAPAFGGETKCMFHKSQVEYVNMRQCKDDINKSEQLIIGAIFDHYGNEPIDHMVKASCFNGV
jgi:hypothetical protein